MKSEATPDPDTSFFQLALVASRDFDADCLSFSAEMIAEWEKINRAINKAWSALDRVAPAANKCGLSFQQRVGEADSTVLTQSAREIPRATIVNLRPPVESQTGNDCSDQSSDLWLLRILFER